MFLPQCANFVLTQTVSVEKCFFRYVCSVTRAINSGGLRAHTSEALPYLCDKGVVPCALPAEVVVHSNEKGGAVSCKTSCAVKYGQFTELLGASILPCPQIEA